MKQNILFILFFIFSFSAFATHERAGEITYTHISGNTYSITITTYTKGSSTPADRCSLLVNFGDDTSHYLVCRSNFEPGDPQYDYWGGGPCSDPNCATSHMGQWTIGAPQLSTLDIKKNVYSTTHTFPSNIGTFIISMTDADRNNGVVNVPDQTPLSVQDTLILNPFFGYNSSPILTNPPIDRACVGKLFIHNPGAVDPDGDSLSYKLGVCFEDVDTPIPPGSHGYFIPPGVSVNPLNGDFIWNTPTTLPPPNTLPYEYNFAMDIEEWRKIPGFTKRFKIGTVRRDMQVRVYDCNHNPPVVDVVNDTCILENTALTLTVTAHASGANDLQFFTATGGPFNTTPAATFTLLPLVNDPFLQIADTGIFAWKPTCEQVRQQPYLVTLKGTDDGGSDGILLSDYKSFYINVIAPAPKNLTVSPQCSNMLLKWDAAICNPASNPLYQYKIYRKIDSTVCDTLHHHYCETGMPSYWGYSLLATVLNSTTSYLDNNGGIGLSPGTTYSYRVVAVYLDGAESYVSDPVCSKLVRDIPIITNVDVVSTGTNGSINVKWLKPLADTADFDTLKIPGPYKLQLLRVSPPPSIVVAAFTSPYFATLATSYLDTALNTSASAYSYLVNLYSDTTALCPSQKASSVFLSCISNDHQIQITWNEQVPWTNSQYIVYKHNPVTSNWDSIGITTGQTFTDTGLVNLAQYCYKVKSIGAYPDSTLPHPLFNRSQELCCDPVDHTPPCPNTLAVDYNCEHNQNILNWTNPNSTCSKDAIYYIIYHTDSTAGDYHVMDTIHNIQVLTFIDDSLNSIAGCYAITSVDSAGNQSAYSNIVCVDNCPYYELPNVFTPNGDGKNDQFTPIHPYKYVRDIDIQIFNRWGNLVFHTTDPEIRWDGKSIQTKMLCADGVYYYVCVVNDIRLEGIVPHVLTGFVQLLSSSGK